MGLSSGYHVIIYYDALEVKALNIPNMLTVIRLLLIPVFIRYYTSGELIMALTVYLVAGVTDVLDGYIARRYDLSTKLGTVLDPLADKLMLLTALGCLSFSAIIPMWVFYIVVLKEGAMILGAAIMYFGHINRVIPSNVFGKIATIVFYIAVATSLLEAKPFYRDLTMMGAVIIMGVAFVNYLYLYFRDHPANEMNG